ncbi:hypothetical protein BDP27DRAFT_366344 [Rhodocollybia butyracea]|uniref:Uncharacterized protein n=1 Tax=Rhodocollybia butyracea TaxID=206335 RepID=A0A9P5UB90_9AGAR|nr:hypothetical protein BDP27DRAFT_366344 [Rhodocollybia butyracea]
MTTALTSSSRLLFKTVARTRAAGPVTSRYTTTRFSSAIHDNDPEVLEKEKHRNLSKTQHTTSTPHDHAPGWNEHLASTSEAYVKADRSGVSPQELAEKTIKYVHARHHADPESSNNLEPTEAVYSRDEVGGPLRHARPGEKVMEEEEETVEKSTKVYSNSSLYRS